MTDENQHRTFDKILVNHNKSVAIKQNVCLSYYALGTKGVVAGKTIGEEKLSIVTN